MKKPVFLFLTILSFAMFSLPIFSQSIIGVWQVQNPVRPSVSEMLLFRADKQFYDTTVDLVTKQSGITCGYYEFNDGALLLKFNQACGGARIYCSIGWIKETVFGLAMDGSCYVLAKSKSADDHFFSNFIAGEFLNAQQTSHVCVPCNGTGYCHVCDGKGYLYQGKVCPSCHGRRTCPFCNGKGHKYYY
jgi:hypothetical protein